MIRARGATDGATDGAKVLTRRSCSMYRALLSSRVSIDARSLNPRIIKFSKRRRDESSVLPEPGKIAR